jgi:putative hydrolase of the HAD superfamily
MIIQSEVSIMINTIIFDIGNVLLDFDYMKQFRRLFDEKTAQTIADISIRKPEIWVEMDRGVLSYEEAVNLIIQGAPHLENEIRIAIKELYENVDSFPYAVDWVKHLKKKGYRIYILSNYGEKPFADSKVHMPFLQFVDGKLISYEIQEVKPNAAIYQTICDRFSINLNEAVFIDDSAANITGAQAFGLNTILFKTYEDAVDQLRKLPLAYGV